MAFQSSFTLYSDIGLNRRRQRVINAANICAVKRLATEIRSLETEAKFYSYKYDQDIKEMRKKNSRIQDVMMETATRKALSSEMLSHSAGASMDNRRRSAVEKLAASKTGKEISDELVNSLKKMIEFVNEHVEDIHLTDDNVTVHLIADDVTGSPTGVQISVDDESTVSKQHGYFTTNDNTESPPDIDYEEVTGSSPSVRVTKELYPLSLGTPQDTNNLLMINIEITPPTPSLSSRESTSLKPLSESSPSTGTDKPTLSQFPTTKHQTYDGAHVNLSTRETSSLNDTWVIQPLASRPAMSSDELRVAVRHIYADTSNTSDVNVEDVIKRLQPIIRRSTVKPLDVVRSTHGGATGDQTPQNEHLNTLKIILNTEFPESRIQQQIDEKALQRAKNREKKLWTRLKTMPMVLPPIHQHKKTKFLVRYWDFDSAPRKVVVPSIKEEDWEEMKYCKYLRPAMTKFHVPGSTLFT